MTVLLKVKIYGRHLEQIEFTEFLSFIENLTSLMKSNKETEFGWALHCPSCTQQSWTAHIHTIQLCALISHRDLCLTSAIMYYKIMSTMIRKSAKQSHRLKKIWQHTHISLLLIILFHQGFCTIKGEHSNQILLGFGHINLWFHIHSFSMSSINTSSLSV